MPSGKMRTILFWFNALLAFSLNAGLLFLCYYLFRSRFEVGLVQTIVIVGILGLFIMSITVYGYYKASRYQSRDEYLIELTDRTAKLIPTSPKIWFWLLSPLMIPLFAYIYYYPMIFIASIVLSPFGETARQYVQSIAQVISILCIIFSVGTVFWLWRKMKKHFPAKEPSAG